MELSPNDISSVPTDPGCYLFKTAGGEDQKQQILYVGKAKNLRARVRQYFISDGDQRHFVRFIRERTSVIEYIVTKDEQDAFVLENELIKKFKPTYNISLKDDKRYLSLRLDIKHEWPRVEIVRKIKKDKAIYLGPFSSASRLKETLNIMQKVFPLRTCPDRKLYNRTRPCIEYDIKRCVAPCVNLCTREEYQRLVDSVVMFLQGKSEELLNTLHTKMSAAAEKENFEEAAMYRNQIQAVMQITQSQTGVVNPKQVQSGVDADAFGVAVGEERSVVYAIFVRGGVIWDQRSFEFSKKGLDEKEILVQVISRYYSSEVYIPHEVLVPFAIEVPGLPSQVKLIQPRAAEKLSFIETAERNAKARLQSAQDKKDRVSKVLDQLQTRLGLSRKPSNMDCIDISHHQGAEVVASVVRFTDGFPNKDFYRKIKLSQDIVDDFASMREAIDRRYRSKDDLPDLLVVDGGRGQLSAVVEVLKTKDYLRELDVVGMAKARSTDELIDPLNPLNRERIFKIGQKNPILLEEDSPAELLLTFLRDEAHRFAISYHRKRKADSLSFSLLDEVKGISSRTKLKLLKRFGSLEGIQEADDYELLKIVKPNVLEELRQRLSSVDNSNQTSENEGE